MYIGKCVPTGKVLVGSSIRLKQRTYSHISLLRADNHYNSYLQRAWNKYGEENFAWDVLERCSEDQQFIREQYWINTLRSHERDFGFNIAFPVRQLLPSKRMSEIHKALWADLADEERQRRNALSIASLKSAHAQWEDPIRAAELRAKVLANVSSAHKRWHTDPEYRARKTQWLLDASAKALKNWDDPEFRAKHVPRLAAQAKAASDANAKKLAEDPEYRERFKARMVEHNRKIAANRVGKKSPAVASKAKERWADPEFIARTTEAIRAGRRRAMADKPK